MGNLSDRAATLDESVVRATLRKGDIVEVIANPRPGCHRTRAYIREPAEIVIVINANTFLVRMIDDFFMTVDKACIREL